MKLHDRLACPLCQSAGHQTHLEFGLFEVVRCVECEFLFTKNIYESDDLEKFYTDGYHGLRHQRGQTVNAATAFEVISGFDVLSSCETVLDVGSGYGFFLSAVKRNWPRIEVTGVELAKAEADYANVAGIHTLANVNQIPADQKYDLITLFEVIEHIPDPVEFVKTLLTKLKTGGHIVIGTDNFGSDVVRKLGRAFPKWIPHQHISLFEPHSIQYLVRRVGGLDVVSEKSFTPWDLTLRSKLFQYSGGRIGGGVFDIDQEIESENDRQYKLFALRKLITPVIAKLTMRSDLREEMMFVAARKTVDDRDGEHSG